MPDETSVKMQQLEELQEATNRLVRTVDGFKGDDWSAASGLPGWTRAHVVAHLALGQAPVTLLEISAELRRAVAVDAGVGHFDFIEDIADFPGRQR